MCLKHISLVICLLAVSIHAEDRWVWREHNRQERAFKDNRQNGIRNSNEKYRREQYSRNEREREPTTKRPLAGEIQNDDIDDDYPDNLNTNTNVGTRQYPQIPPTGGGFNAGQIVGAGGFGPYVNNVYGAFGGSPGVLVGPGGPTGIIGRPQQQFPYGAIGGGGVYQPGFGSFNGAQNGLGIPGGYGGGYPTQGFYPSNPAQSGLGSFQGAQFPGFGQYPNPDFGGNQFVGPSQYPSSQFGVNPQYTEGYGLAYTNGQPSFGPYGSGFGFDENSGKRDIDIAEGKSAKLQNSELTKQVVDDKVSKVLKKL